ncbi:ubiquinone biosynthesis protein [Massilia sp. W12]|uniref:ubiquinone biosynthesis protein n=1 Tax=Massilia sp. W12 TaxID=3126507 RepID=UPI0030CC86C1
MTLWQLLGSFPTIIPGIFLAILLVYWLFSIIGLVDLGDNLELDSGDGAADVHLHTDAHAESTDLHSLASYLVALGLGGVPLSIVLTLLVFFTWLLSALIHKYLLQMLGSDVLRYLAGAMVLLLSAACSIRLSALAIKPLRPLFVKHHARSNHSLTGLSCMITTLSVDEKFGRAEVKDTGVNLNIRVWAKTPNHLRKKSIAVILSYDETKQRYEVAALDKDSSN